MNTAATGFGPGAALYVDWTGSSKGEPPYALYFFRNHQYIRWDIDHEQLFPDYPRDIADGWPGLLDVCPGTPLSGAMSVPGWHNKIYFFFRGQTEVAVWDIESNSLEASTIDIGALMPSHLTQDGHFAPVHVDRGDHQTVYAFRGDAYTRFTVSEGHLPEREDQGYPRKIGDGWTGGLSVMPTCAVSVRWTTRSASLASHKLYFFLGDLYTRWDVKSHSNNYRLDIPSGWKGWPEFK